MNKIQVKDLMVPIDQYATVSEDATLADALVALETSQRAFDATRYPHRAILVLDQNQRTIAKISQRDALKALEPKYDEIQSEDSKTYFRHFSRMFLTSMIEHHGLFAKPLENLRQRAAEIHVKDFMQTLSKDECLSEQATLDEAIHLFILGHHQSLLVHRDDEIIGILRLTDVFSAVFESFLADPEGS